MNVHVVETALKTVYSKIVILESVILYKQGVTHVLELQDLIAMQMTMISMEIIVIQYVMMD